MKFNLTKDLVFFDIESTGLNILKDRILQIALIKYFADGRDPLEKEMLINPGVPISPDAMAVHGIGPDQVRNKPLFPQVAKELFEWIGDADIAGYNSDKFDIPMLMEEFARAGFEFDIDNRRNIDVQRIFYKMEPRTLSAALKFYCDKEIENAHDALEDVRATAEVFAGQIKKYENMDYVDVDGNLIPTPLKNDMESIYQFTRNTKMLDVTMRLKYDNNGVVIFNFGKYMGKPAGEILYRDRQYYNWILEKDFSTQVKNLVKKLLKQYEEGLKASS